MIAKLILIALLPLSAYAQAGQSAFAIQHPKFPCDKFLHQFKNVSHPTIAILDGTFGSDLTCLNKFLALPNNKTVQIHIRYVKKNVVETLNRNVLITRAKKWESFRKRYPSNRWLLSDGLESHSSVSASRQRIFLIRKYFNGEIVHNPFVPRDPYLVGASIIELHGARYTRFKGRSTIFNYDGFGIYYDIKDKGRDLFQTSVSNVRRDIEKAKRDQSIIFLWDAPAQGLISVRNNPDPVKRTFYSNWSAIKRDLLKSYDSID